MVTAIVVRELLIQGLRSLLEGQGKAFGARLAGKLKTTVQCFSISAALLGTFPDVTARMAALGSGHLDLAGGRFDDLQRCHLSCERDARSAQPGHEGLTWWNGLNL